MSEAEPIVCRRCRNKQAIWTQPCPHWEDELVTMRRGWLFEFWDAKGDYDYCKRRSPLARERANQRMLRAVDALQKLGAIRMGYGLPTVDQADGRVPRGSAWVEPFLRKPQGVRA